jgi:polyhydroxybutyrate depolymerase
MRIMSLGCPLSLSILMVLASCGGEVSSAPAGPPSGGTAGQDPPETSITISTSGEGGRELPPPREAEFPTVVSDPCAAGTQPRRGDVYRLLSSSGGLRWFALHVPPGYAGAPTALVLNFHGFTSDPIQEAILSGMNAAADRRGILVAYPAGLVRSWNAGACCGSSALLNVRDVAFAADVIDTVAREYCVDRRRVYATGMSNGGFLSHRLACELSERIAAVAPVAGVLGVLKCAPQRPVPVMSFHGVLDGLVPLLGNPLLGFAAVRPTYQSWSQRSGCGGAEVTTYQKGDSSCVTRPGCRGGSESTLCISNLGGHTWPGGFPVPVLGHTTRDMNATEMMLDFFERHPMP